MLAQLGEEEGALKEVGSNSNRGSQSPVGFGWYETGVGSCVVVNIRQLL